MKGMTRIVGIALLAILSGAVVSGLTARQTSACDGLAQAVDCYDAASLSYSPRDPGPGDYVYINAVIDATVSNAPGFSSTLYVDGEVYETNQVYYNGCEINVAYYYTCEEQQYPVYMTIPGRSCDGSSAGILGGLAVVGVLVVIGAGGLVVVGVIIRRITKPRPPQTGPQQQIASYQLEATPAQITITPGQSAGFQVRAWALEAAGARRPAAEMSLSLHCNEPALTVGPAAGMGTLNGMVSLAGEPGSERAQITVTGTVAGYPPVTCTVPVQIQAMEQVALQTQLDPNRRTLRPDGQDMVTLWARVITQPPPAGASQPAGPDPELQAANDSIEFIRVGEAENWLYDNTPQESDGWKAFLVKSVDLLMLNRQFGPTHPPSQGVAVRVQAQYKEQVLSETFTFQIADAPVIRTDPQAAHFCAGRAGERSVRAWLEGDWPGPWNLEASYLDEELAMLTVQPLGEKEIEIKLLGPTQEPAPGIRLSDSYLKSRVSVRASRGDVEIEAQFDVIVYREGLYVADGLNQEGYCVLRADVAPGASGRKSHLDLKAMVWDRTRQEMVQDQAVASALDFSVHPNSPQELVNMFQVVRLLTAHTGGQGGAYPPGTWSLEIDQTVPGKIDKGPVGWLEVRSQARPDIKLNLPVDVRLAVADEKQVWQQAYINCRYIIENYLPDKEKAEALEYLQRMSRFWGIQELNDHRQRIWRHASWIIFSEADSYMKSAYWYDVALTGAEWVKWVNDRAFTMVSGAMLGPVGGLAVGELKEAIEMLLDTYISNPDASWSDWFLNWGKSKFVGGVGNTGNWILDQAYDVSNPKTFVILGCWRFINHYFFLSTPEGNPKGVYGALKDTFWDLSGTVIEKTMGGYFKTWKISR